MADLSNTLHNKSKLRIACKNLTSQQMQNVISNLEEFIEKRAKEEALLEEERAFKEEKKQEIITAMKEGGFSYEDFADTGTSVTKKVRKPVAPQYRITDDNGSIHEWSGRGLTPAIFKAYFDNGGSKDSCRT